MRDELHDRLLAMMDAANDPFAGLAWEQRSWRSTQHDPWSGSEPVTQADGYSPDFRHYRTGQPIPQE